MQVTIHSTTKLVELEIDGAVVLARVWEGQTAGGAPVFCFITRIAPAIPIPELPAEIEAEFDRELKLCATPSVLAAAIPARFIL